MSTKKTVIKVKDDNGRWLRCDDNNKGNVDVDIEDDDIQRTDALNGPKQMTVEYSMYNLQFYI